jgi:hypothetical protein
MPVATEESDRFEREALVKRAQGDLGCADVTIDKRNDTNVMRARGCSKHAVYLRSYRDAATDERMAVVEFADVSRIEPGSPEAKRDPVLSALVEIQVQAATDLQCPRADVFPEVISTHGAAFPAAEGCDKRATYLPPTPESSELRLMAVAPARGAPTGFVPWTP